MRRIVDQREYALRREQSLAQRGLDRRERLHRLERQQGRGHEAHELAESDVAVDPLPAAVEHAGGEAEAGQHLPQRADRGARARRLHEILAYPPDESAQTQRFVRLLAIGLDDPHALQRLRQRAVQIARYPDRAPGGVPDLLPLAAQIEDRERRAEQHDHAQPPIHVEHRAHQEDEAHAVPEEVGHHPQ